MAKQSKKKKQTVDLRSNKIAACLLNYKEIGVLICSCATLRRDLMIDTQPKNIPLVEACEIIGEKLLGLYKQASGVEFTSNTTPEIM